ncbi:hypothetical protein [Soonwooa sp.]|uniref:hypothetical protein n=1 Tax=Soonwooa sp. TaxID=1938592 RepID=UPI00261A18CC|nr:hypothetical protein [Soonwooa sp.]
MRGNKISDLEMIFGNYDSCQNFGFVLKFNSKLFEESYDIARNQLFGDSYS